MLMTMTMCRCIAFQSIHKMLVEIGWASRKYKTVFPKNRGSFVMTATMTMTIETGRKKVGCEWMEAVD